MYKVNRVWRNSKSEMGLRHGCEDKGVEGVGKNFAIFLLGCNPCKEVKISVWHQK